MKKTVSHSLAETQNIAQELLSELATRPRKGAAVLALHGDLGAGKTALTAMIARELGVDEAITSPTFVIEKVYALAEGKPFRKLVHVDAYRLESAAELVHLGWNELLKDSSALISIEWPGNVPGVLPDSALKVECVFIDETTREYSY